MLRWGSSAKSLGPHRFLTMPSTTKMSDGGPIGSRSNRITISDLNLNPVLQIVTWLLLAFTTLVLLFRLFTNILVKARRPVSLEDLLFLSAYVSHVAFLSLFSKIRILIILV